MIRFLPTHGFIGGRSDGLTREGPKAQAHNPFARLRHFDIFRPCPIPSGERTASSPGDQAPGSATMKTVAAASPVLFDGSPPDPWVASQA
jgi:hypothetical protein